MRAHQVHPWDTRRPGATIRSPVTGITDGRAGLCHVTAAVWVLGLQACTATPTQLIGSISINTAEKKSSSSCRCVCVSLLSDRLLKAGETLTSKVSQRGTKSLARVLTGLLLMTVLRQGLIPRPQTLTSPSSATLLGR